MCDIRNMIKELFPQYYQYKSDTMDEFNLVYKFYLENLDNISFEREKDMMALDSLGMLFTFLDEFIDSFCFAEAGNRIANDIIDNEPYKLTWEKHYRDREIRYLIPRYFYFLDYMAMIFYELFHEHIGIEKTPKQISYERLKKWINDYLCKNKNSENLKTITLIKRMLDNLLGFNEYQMDIIVKYRNVITHRYMPGIDEIIKGYTYGNFENRVKRKNHLYSIQYDDKPTMKYFGGPEFKYNEIKEIVIEMIYKMHETLIKLYEIEYFKAVLEKINK